MNAKGRERPIVVLRPVVRFTIDHLRLHARRWSFDVDCLLIFVVAVWRRLRLCDRSCLVWRIPDSSRRRRRGRRGRVSATHGGARGQADHCPRDAPVRKAPTSLGPIQRPALHAIFFSPDESLVLTFPTYSYHRRASKRSAES